MLVVGPTLTLGPVLTPYRGAQAELKEKLATMYDVRDPNTIFVFGFRTQVRSIRA